MSNPEFHTCECGFTWRHGMSGNHLCSTYYQKTIVALQAKLAAAPVQPAHFPQRHTSKPAEQQGVFKKFDVWRTDGSSAPGGKHHDCRYFALDVDHDALAKPALQAYAAACVASHPELSADMVKRFDLAPVKPVAVPDPLYQAMRDFRDDVLSGINGLDNDQINAVLSTFDNYMLDDPAAPAELQGVATRIGVSTCPSDDGKTIAVVGMAVQEGVSFVFYTGNHSITQDASGFVDINFQRLMEK